MKGQRMRFDWAAYYMAAYEEERKKNTQTAGYIADAERRQALVQDNLNRIRANPLYRFASKATAPLQRAVCKITGTALADESLIQAEASPERQSAYEDELWLQKNPYLQWIQACEDKITDDMNEEPIPVQGLQEIEVPGTDVCILTYGTGMLSPDTLSRVKSFFEENSACLLAYADEDFYWEDLTKRMEPWFKPVYSPDTLLAFQYWGHFLAMRLSVLEGMSFRMVSMKNPDLGFYEICLRLEERIIELTGGNFWKMQEAVGHLESVLYHRRYTPLRSAGTGQEGAGSERERFAMVQESLRRELAEGRFLMGASAQYVTLKEDTLLRRGLRGIFVQGADPDIYHLLYDTSVSGSERCTRSGSENTAIAPHRMVSVIIPSKDHPEALEKCLRSFRERTQYRFYEWIVVDNGSSEENREKIEALQRTYGFTYIYEPMPFHFSKMCNLGEKRARGDLILLMNDDMEVIEGSWLGRMTGQAMQSHVGAVGAKLWYAGSENIQHAGITNLKIGPSHKLITFPDVEDYYYGRNRVTYNVVAVTGACLMVSRKKYEEVGGLDENLPVAYNDVDFCFKLLEAGYLNVQRNDAILYHYESLSRGLDEQNDEKWKRLLEDKEKLYRGHAVFRGQDPFYHKNLIDNASHYGCNYKLPHEDALHTQEVAAVQKSVLKKTVKKAVQDAMKLTVDRAEPQHKILEEEPDIIWIMGWSYVPGADNAAFERKVILQKSDGAGYLAVPADWNRVDVENILPEEKNIGLAGFVLRLRREKLEPGEYRIGMLAERKAAGENAGIVLAAWSDKTVKV